MLRPTNYWAPNDALSRFHLAMGQVGDEELMDWLEKPENLEKVRRTFLEKPQKDAVDEGEESAAPYCGA